jgi:hypothetical protein
MLKRNIIRLIISIFFILLCLAGVLSAYYIPNNFLIFANLTGAACWSFLAGNITYDLVQSAKRKK